MNLPSFLPEKSAFLPLLIGASFAWDISNTCGQTEKSPNIVILLADDLGYGELSCQDPDTDIPTPHIDSIAQNGVRFTDGYVTAPFCAASRAGLMTGRYQTRFGFEFNPTGAKNEEPGIGLPRSEVILPELLREQAGYTTALIGKWHLGGTAPFNPLRRGFDEFFGFTHEGHYFVPPPWRGVTTWLRRRQLPGGGEGRWTSEDGKTVLTTHMGNTEPDYDADNPILRAGQPVVEEAYLTDAFTREAVDFIHRNRDRPFLLCLAYNAVHSPLQGKDADMERFSHIEDIQRRIFAAMLGNLDDSVGEVLQKLRDEKLQEKTLVFFLSDNGGPTRELTSSNAPLRGEKGSVFEGGLRVPFLAQWPGQIDAGMVFRKPVLSLDILATAIARAGIEPPKNRPIDGADLLPHLSGEKENPPHPEIFWRVGNRAALRSGNWKLLRNPRRGEGSDWQLFDLADDISESENLAAEKPEKLAELLERWESLDSEMVEPLW